MIKSKSKKVQVYELIKKRIYKKYYATGEQLVISNLSEELGVSNTPIREALSYLESEGLIEYSDNYQYRIKTINEKDVVDLNKAVKIIIANAYEICIQEGKRDSLVKKLDRSQQEILNMFHEESKYDYKYILKSLEFNKIIVKETENKYMLKLYDELEKTLLLFSLYNKSDFRKIHLEEHEKMIDAIKKEEDERFLSVLETYFNKNYYDMEI